MIHKPVATSFFDITDTQFGFHNSILICVATQTITTSLDNNNNWFSILSSENHKSFLQVSLFIDITDASSISLIYYARNNFTKLQVKTKNIKYQHLYLSDSSFPLFILIFFCFLSWSAQFSTQSLLFCAMHWITCEITHKINSHLNSYCLCARPIHLYCCSLLFLFV